MNSYHINEFPSHFLGVMIISCTMHLLMEDDLMYKTLKGALVENEEMKDGEGSCDIATKPMQ